MEKAVTMSESGRWERDRVETEEKQDWRATEGSRALVSSMLGNPSDSAIWV